jgi:phosphohistidine phosphatase
VYLVRHGEAKPEAEDPARPLTDEGREVVRRMAAWAASAGIQVVQVCHSGKLRAQQTAEVFAEYLRPAQGVAVSEGLKPKDEVEFIADKVAAEPGPLMLVGHLPHLERLVARLVVGDADASVVEFGPSALVALAQRKNRWVLRCTMQPDLLS